MVGWGITWWCSRSRSIKVVILGGGVVGAHAAHMAVGMGADVWVLDNNPETLEQHWQQFGRSTNTVFSTKSSVEEYVLQADLVIGGVLIPGAEAPKLVSREMIKAMKPGSVIVDVAIDQGGCLRLLKLQLMQIQLIWLMMLCIIALQICLWCS